MLPPHFCRYNAHGHLFSSNNLKDILSAIYRFVVIFAIYAVFIAAITVLVAITFFHH